MFDVPAIFLIQPRPAAIEKMHLNAGGSQVLAAPIVPSAMATDPMQKHGSSLRRSDRLANTDG
jgi:hypothetical protein